MGVIEAIGTLVGGLLFIYALIVATMLLVAEFSGRE